MSSTTSRLIVVILILSVGLPLVLTFSILWYFGVLELVAPILMPILIPIITLAIIAIIAFPILCQAASRQALVDVPESQLWDGPSVGIGRDETVRDVRGTFYLIPVYCPSCRSEINLESASWVGSQVFQCQNCLSDIDIRVVEGLRG